MLHQASVYLNFETELDLRTAALVGSLLAASGLDGVAVHLMSGHQLRVQGTWRDDDAPLLRPGAPAESFRQRICRAVACTNLDAPTLVAGSVTSLNPWL